MKEVKDRLDKHFFAVSDLGVRLERMELKVQENNEKLENIEKNISEILLVVNVIKKWMCY